VDLHRFDADPDADPDSTYHPDADPDFKTLRASLFNGDLSNELNFSRIHLLDSTFNCTVYYRGYFIV
jgi:hypothetical protein